MWYGGQEVYGEGYRIGYATSENGEIWDKHQGFVFGSGPAGTWYSGGGDAPTVVWDENIEKYVMYFQGSAGQHWKIGVAFSSDGKIWDELPDPIIDLGSIGDWDDTHVAGSSVIIQDDIYRVWYVGGNQQNIGNIGYAEDTNAPSEEGLVAYYPFNDNTYDMSGNVNHGTRYGLTDAEDRFGNPEKALYFDGGDDFIKVPSSQSLQLNRACTIAGWVKIDEGINYNVYGYRHILSKGATHGGLYEDYSVALTNPTYPDYNNPEGGLQWAAAHSSYARTDESIPEASWHHIATTFDYDEQEIKLYIDGQIQSAYYYPLPWQLLRASDHPLYIGIRYESALNYRGQFQGIMDELRIYNKALSETEINELYTEGGWIPEIEVDPISYDFGEVEINSDGTLIATISNSGPADLLISSIILRTGSSTEFSIIYTPDVPFRLSAGETAADIGLSFTPSTEGLSEAFIDIYSNDPDDPLVTIQLAGTGVEYEPPPDEQIQIILDFIDEKVEDGDLIPIPSGKSDPGLRVKAIKDKIETAGGHFEEGDLDGACSELEDAYKKTDGIPTPKDWFEGVASAELAEKILDLKVSMGCDGGLPKLRNINEYSSLSSVPQKFLLDQNYPNPFNPTTTIGFSLPEANFVVLKIYNTSGQEVATLISDDLEAGIYRYTWNASDLSSGIYYYQLRTASSVFTKKLILLK